MISPLSRGHRGGTLNITSSWALYSIWGRGTTATEGCTTGTLGSAPAAATEGAATAEGLAAAELGPDVEVPAWEMGPWRTRSLKE